MKALVMELVEAPSANLNRSIRRSLVITGFQLALFWPTK